MGVSVPVTVKIHPGTAPTVLDEFHQHNDLDSLADFDDDNKVIANELNAWVTRVKALSSAQRALSTLVGVAPDTSAITHLFSVIYDGIIAASGVAKTAAGFADDLNQSFQQGVASLTDGLTLSNVGSASHFFMQQSGLLSVSTTFSPGTLLGLSSDGSLITFAAGIHPPTAFVKVSGKAVYAAGGRVMADNTSIQFGTDGKLKTLTVPELRTPLRNETGGILAKGTLVAALGFNVGENRPTVVIADKDDSTKRPALAVTEASVANNTNFEGLVLGVLTGLNTSAFSGNDQLVLGNAGAVSRPPPDVDPFTGEIQLVGSTVRIDASSGSILFNLATGLLPMTAAHFFATRETSPTGNVSGGEVTRVSGLNVAVAAGTGFVNNGTDVFRVPYSAVSSLALTASDTNFIFVDKNGLVQASVSPPALGDNIVLADAITNGTSVILLANHNVLLRERPAKFHDYAKDVVGNVVVSGLIASQATAALRVKVDLGTFYTRDFRVSPPATDPVTFTYWFRDGSGGFTRVAGSTLIDKDNFDDGSGTLAALIATEFKKDLLFVVSTASGVVEYHVFYGQEKFTSQATAESGDLPAADSDVIANGVRSSGIVIEGAAAAIASFVDVRPFLGQLAPGVTAVTDHGLLSGLGDDDHTQYVLRSILTTKGDIFVRDASGVIRLAVGANGQVLTADSAEASGLKYATVKGEVLRFYADQLDNPVNSDWAVNALAPAAADSNNAGLTVRLFDDTTEEGVGFITSVPAGKTNLKISFKSRAETAPGATRTVGLKLYQRGILDNAAVEAWSAGTVLTDIDIPTNEFFQYDTQTITLASLGITAGELTQFELTRINPAGGTELTGDWSLAEIVVEFT